MSSNYAWDTAFRNLYDRCLERFRGGDADFEGYYSQEDLSFLRGIGCKPREFFDYVEDLVDFGDPCAESALLIAAVRRDYLAVVQDSSLSDHEIQEPELPGKENELGGCPWLPRLIAKAVGKLSGELDPDIMYGCGGDREFLCECDIHPADFLRAVWAADGDEAKVLEFVKERSGG
ncbi:MAG: hypothetical protein ACC661_07445 [Verrucomicrobiales bacterium]